MRFRRLIPALALAPVLFGLAGCDELLARTPGERLWRRHCADCHGIDASGNTPRYMGEHYADLRDDAWKNGGDRGSIENVVREGIFAKMPANEKLTAEEMRLLLDYLFELRGERG